MRPAARILSAWHRSVNAGHCINPTQLIILCDVMEHPQEVISCSARGRRLRLTMPTIRLALHHLKDLGLVTHTHHKHAGMPSISAHPTPAAYKLFHLRAPKQSPTAPSLIPLPTHSPAKK